MKVFHNKMSKNILASFVRVKIKLIESYGKYIALIKNREICKSDLFNQNLTEWDRCFEDRLPKEGLPHDKVARIVRAYKCAMQDMNQRDLYYISDEWVPIYKKYMGEVIDSLASGDVSTVERLYMNFFRDRLSTGLCGLPTNMERFYLKAPTTVNKYWYLMDACHKLEALERKMGRVPTSELTMAPIGNPYGIYRDGVFVRSGADYHYYYSKKIQGLLDSCDHKRVIEIGGGFGGMAAFLMKNSAVEQYVDVDLPETLALATYYLMSNFPNESFSLYGEHDHGESMQDFRFVMLPSFAIENIQNSGFGVAFNSYSFSEMSSESANNYIDILGTLAPKHIVHVNHTKNAATKADDFDLEKFGYSLINRSISDWNHGRSFTADEFEFHYRK